MRITYFGVKEDGWPEGKLWKSDVGEPLSFALGDIFAKLHNTSEMKKTQEKLSLMFRVITINGIPRDLTTDIVVIIKPNY